MPIDYAAGFAEEADPGIAAARFRALFEEAAAEAESRFGPSHQTWPLDRLRVRGDGVIPNAEKVICMTADTQARGRVRRLAADKNFVAVLWRFIDTEKSIDRGAT